MKARLVAPVVFLLSALPAASAPIVICTNPDGTKYAGTNPPEGCVVAGKSDESAAARAQAASVEGVEHVRAYCALEWPDDSRMREACARKQVEALAWLATMGEENRGNEQYEALVDRCRQSAKQSDARDAVLVKHCLEKEIAIYRDL